MFHPLTGTNGSVQFFQSDLVSVLERLNRLFGSADYRGEAIVRELGFRPRYTLEDVAADLLDPDAG